jgi:hypothetical protein
VTLLVNFLEHFSEQNFAKEPSKTFYFDGSVIVHVDNGICGLNRLNAMLIILGRRVLAERRGCFVEYPAAFDEHAREISKISSSPLLLHPDDGINSLNGLPNAMLMILDRCVMLQRFS